MRFYIIVLTIGILTPCISFGADEELTIAIKGLKDVAEKEKHPLWNTVLGPIVGGVLAIFGSVIIPWFNNRRQRPNITTSVEPEKGCRVNILKDDKGNAVDDIYLRLKVSNVGMLPGKSCQGFLTRAEKFGCQTNRWEALPFYDTIPFIWAYGWDDAQVNHKTKEDIVKGVDYFLDIACHSANLTEARILIASRKGVSHNLISAPGTYRLHILLTAKEIPSKMVTLELTLVGGSNRITMTQLLA